MKKPLPSHPLPSLLQDFFCQHLQSQRHASPQTIASYRDTVRLLLAFVQQQLRRPPSQQSLEDWNVPMVLRFLNYLEESRHNSVRTRNARLAAIHSFLDYVGQKLPETLGFTSRLLAIPAKRFDRPLLGYLSKPEIRLLLQTPSRPTWTDCRNQVLWLLLYNTGARISEILALNRQDIQWMPSPAAQIRGKGRKYGKVVVMERGSTRTLQRQGAVQPELSITTGCRGSEVPRRLAETESWQFVAGGLLPVPAFSSPSWLRHRGGWF